MYRMDTVFSLILLVSEMLKKCQVEGHFLKKVVFVTNKCVAQDGSGKYSRKTENLSK